MPEQLIDHLFRHQFGKMVSILTKIFGFEHLSTIEDAVQDTFIKAVSTWRNGIPENPEAWLTAAAKNRVIDIFRSIQSEKDRSTKSNIDYTDSKIDELFLDHEIEDSQLRMIFTACHPMLGPQEQIAFSLRTISGFSVKEIAAALMTNQDTIKKRLQRARKGITKGNIAFEIPIGDDLPSRLDRVIEVIYVIFNEGFHSNKKELIIRKDLCGEAMRLCKIILKKTALRSPKVYALFALMCFHSSRLDSKISGDHELIVLKDQDRSLWYFPLIAVGNEAMNKAVELTDHFSSYHYEAAIAAEHLRAPTFESTNWKTIAEWYKNLFELQPTTNTKLNLAIVYLQIGDLTQAYTLLLEITSKDLAQKEYIFYATFAEYYHRAEDQKSAIVNIDLALSYNLHDSERRYLEKKKELYKKEIK